MLGNSSLDRESRPIRRVLVFARLLVVVFSVGLLGLLARVGQLQVRPSEPLVRLVDRQHSKRAIHARRGNIVDARGRMLATSQVSTRLFVDPKLIHDPVRFARIVGDVLEYEPGQVVKHIRDRPEGRFVVIDHHLSDGRIDELTQLKMRGLGTQPWMMRRYPQGSHAGQLLGVVGFEGPGWEGLELLYNDELSGRSGSLSYQVDVQRRGLWARDYRAARDGQTIRLTIDLVVQSIAESHLERQCIQYGAEHGQIIVMEPRRGHVLAMANYPFYDPNHLPGSNPDQRRNQCVTDAFEPGSVFKPFIWSMATELGIGDRQEVIDCTASGVYRSPEGRRLRDVRGHGRLTWDEVLIKSSNIGMAIVGQRLGARRIYDTVRTFGFGAPTGSGLPGESPGIVRPAKQWNHYSVTSVPMGQEIAVTGLQLVRALAAIANDGLMPVPTIRARDPGDVPRIYERILSAHTARVTRQVMRRVVTEGTGRKANSDLYTMFGKTGTAQVPDPEHKKYFDDQYVASFISGAPLHEPRLVVGCFIHRPDKEKGYYGGIVAAPAVRRVIEESLVYMGVARQ